MDYDFEDIKESAIVLLSESYTEKSLQMFIKAFLVLKKVDAIHAEFICDHVEGLNSNEDYEMHLVRKYAGNKDLIGFVSELSNIHK
tara:strand:+ start:231 stop:488 length:258 start_codon:yes stop_codon:yes gene_type:complete